MIITPIITALNTSTFTKISLPTGSDQINSSNCNPVSIYTEDETKWYLSDDSAGTNKVTIPATKVLNIECLKADADGCILYAKASAGTPNLAVLVGVELKKR